VAGLGLTLLPNAPALCPSCALPALHDRRMWQITRVARLRPRLTSVYWPLLTRACLIALCGLITSISPNINPRIAVAPALLLLLVAALGTLPLPKTVPLWLQPLTETLAAALVVGALRDSAGLFLPYVLVPLATAGLAAGLGAALVAAALAILVLLLTTLLIDPNAIAAVVGEGGSKAGQVVGLWTWVLIFIAVSVVAAWTRRVSLGQGPPPDPAYADAHRLLSELHVVARQLSLGLDPRTLAAALVEELRDMVDGVVPTVLVRSGSSRFVPLVGDVPTPFAEAVMHDAWVGAETIRRNRHGFTVAALPVLMGARVVAVVVLSGVGPIGDEQLERCRGVIAQAGPRLASALLFDDVRHLATVDERMRLAREIHDGIAQDVASVGYKLDDIASDADAATAARLADLREHLGGLVGDLRLSIYDLRISVDESVGLARTLGDYAQRVGTGSGLVVHVTTNESPHRLPLASEVELLRIVQEAVTNVRKHAEAKHLWLTVDVDPPGARVTVTDDGRGLQPKRLDSMGIQGMHERARRIGARLSVRNRSDGSGTVVEVVIEPPQGVHTRTARPAFAGGFMRRGADQSEPIVEPGAVGTLSYETTSEGRSAWRPWSRR
jgi:signal transduction histidine kinase